MRQGPHSKRGRGRGGNRRPNVPNRNQTFDSNGPDVRIRGNAHQVYEKYLGLARDASTAGDRVLAESLFQHADHYFRIYSAFNEENEARRNAAAQQENAQQPQPEAAAQVSVETPATDGGAASETGESTDDVPARKTRSERRQDAEAAEQAEQQEPRAPRQPRRRRNGAAPQVEGTPASDNDAALRAMLGASESGAPAANGGNDAPVTTDDADPKPVRRRGRPRKTAEPAEETLPLAGED